jgi:MFS family permease
MNLGITVRLSIMMFLQFFIWGAWYVTAPNYLGTIGFRAYDFGWTYSVGPIAGIITPLFVGMVADRFFSAQRVLGVMHLAGGAIMLAATTLMQTASPVPPMINAVFLGYMLTYYPTLALSNTVAMRNMTNPEKEFPPIRVFGTIGWIVAGFLLSAQGWGTKIEMFYLTAGAAFALGIFSFLLPSTPPSKTGKTSVREVLGLDALVLLRDRSYSVFVVSSMLICIPLAFYYQIASRVVEMSEFEQMGIIKAMMVGMGYIQWIIQSVLQAFGFTAGAAVAPDPIGATMAFGQISEIIFMLVMPFFFRRLGVKWMLVIGMAAWVMRYALFSIGAPDQIRWMLLIGILLHGICYDFFFVTGQIYTDRKAPQPIRAQAQGLLVMLTLGVGMLIGAQTAGVVEATFTTERSQQLGEQVQETGRELDQLTAQLQTAPQEQRAELQGRIDEVTAQRRELRRDELRAINWQPLWAIPAVFAAVVMVLFAMFFRDNIKPEESSETGETSEFDDSGERET